MRFGTNANERIRIDSTGKVGIGTATPLAKLDVYGDLSISDTSAYQINNINILTNNFTSNSLALGEGAGNAFNGTGLQNIAIGYQSGFDSGSTTASDGLTTVGYQSGFRNTGDVVSAFGYQSAFQNIGSSVSALGHLSAYQNTGSNVSAVGSRSAYQNTGNNVSAFGFFSASENTGVNLSAFGRESAIQNTGDDVSAFGRFSAYQNTSNNVSAFGYNTLRYIAASTNATVFGNNAGRGAAAGATVANLTAFGFQTGLNLETGADNNLLIGYRAGNAITTGSDNILIGYDVDTSSPTASNELNIGNAVFADLSTGNVGIGISNPVSELQVFGDVRVGNTGTNGCIERYDGGILAGTCTSDESLKDNITALATSTRSVLENLVALTPVTYNWNQEANDIYFKGMDTVNIGLIAQDVENSFPELVNENTDGYLQVDFSALPYYIIQAIKEMWQRIVGLEAKVLEIDDLKERIETLEDTLNVSTPVTQSSDNGSGSTQTLSPEPVASSTATTTEELIEVEPTSDITEASSTSTGSIIEAVDVLDQTATTATNQSDGAVSTVPNTEQQIAAEDNEQEATPEPSQEITTEEELVPET
jgi:hypothetical protein